MPVSRTHPEPMPIPALVVATGTPTQSGTIVATCPSRELAHAIASRIGGHVCITMESGVTNSAAYADSVPAGALVQPDYNAGFHVCIAHAPSATDEA